MPVRLEDYLAERPEDERAEIEARSAELLAEYRTLRELRRRLGQPQEAVARRLGVNQAAVSKLERRADMYLSTLRRLIRALGGELEVVVRFPDQPPARLELLRDLADETETRQAQPPA